MIAPTSPFATALAWALVHFLWQGAAIALVAFAMMRLLRLTASARYQIGVAALAATLLAPMATTIWLMDRPPAPAAAGQIDPGSLPGNGLAAATADRLTGALTNPAPSSTAPAQPRTPRAVLLAVLFAWLAGVTILSIRLVGGWLVTRRLVRRDISPVSHAIEVLAKRVAARLDVGRVVRVFESSAVTVPMMVGWVRPVVLMPVAALAGLTTMQIEALIAHELAHVRRLDYLVNLLQSAVETLLFYHPAVWWLSRQIRIEREHCCDDLAVEVCDRLEYVTALTTLASMATPRLALAATDGSLVRRVRRLLDQGTPEQGAASGWIAAVLGVLILAAVPAGLSVVVPTNGGTLAAAPDAAVVPQAGASEAKVEVQPEQSARPSAERPRLVEPEGLRELREQLDRVLAVKEAEAARQTGAQRTEAQRAAAARLQEAAEQLRLVAAARMALEQSQAAQEAEAEIAMLQQEITGLNTEHARLRRMFEVGLTGQDSVREIEGRLAVAQRKLSDVKARLDLRRRDIELRTREQDLERQRASALDELFRADASMRELVTGRASEQERQRAAQQLTDLQARMQQQLQGLSSVTDPAATARAGDVIGVTIHGEPDLPQSYVVREDGTIRLPLLDAIKVVGLNTTQIEAAIRKQVSRVSTKVDLEVVIRRR
jgi:beta-lactamase regulating signal transducer with metallopeptidase domain